MSFQDLSKRFEEALLNEQKATIKASNQQKRSVSATDATTKVKAN